ncbi:L-lactate dehydrogenase (quinone) large subunit LdhH [Desulfurispira natronophila]|uniref:Iron-sulfur cluster protein n=1 Tax=Desulfurispira natronophila TaxID=682562 RepID=A0A7W8DHM4_9BACT|nr:LUD domain-containing protein [Desulfurispira natronophila]MBB5022711.1 iron-sulfur cluster protein [Desulfurispira natronophila]
MIIKQRIRAKLSDETLYRALMNFARNYKASRDKAYHELDFAALQRDLASMKDHARQQIDQLFQQFKQQAEASGATVHQAATAADANAIIGDICQKAGGTMAVKSKSMTSEETHLNAALEKRGIDVVETDLGEYLLQIGKQHPSHMVMPAIHMTRAQARDIFNEGLQAGLDEDIPAMVEFVRHHLRPSYFAAGVGITGANVAVADSGAIGIVTNEGNARLTATLPPVHIVLLGYEKLVPSFTDALKVIRMLPKSATGQTISTYTTWIKGQTPTPSGSPKQVHFVFLDNGRLQHKDNPITKHSLGCIRCGSCANVCPVYELLGGHVFGDVYIGAIGLIYTSMFGDPKVGQALQKLCASCMACSANCPAGIELHSIIANLRLQYGSKNGVPFIKRLVYGGVLANPSLFRAAMKTAAFSLKPLANKQSGRMNLPLPAPHNFRQLPRFATKTFTDIMKSRTGAERPTEGAFRGKVFFYPGCAVEYFYPEMGQALVQLLERAGVQVDFPHKSVCCGLPAHFGGDAKSAADTVDQALEHFPDPDDYDAILVLCPSCGSAIQHDFATYAECDKHRDLSQQLAAKTTTLSQYIQRTGLQFRSTQGKNITYHVPCHMGRGMSFSAEDLLQSLLGENYVPMADADVCCGFAGSYSVDQPGISAGILGKKLNNAAATGATTLVTDCPGCVMQIGGGAAKSKMELNVIHLSTLLESMEVVTEKMKDKCT